MNPSKKRPQKRRSTSHRRWISPRTLPQRRIGELQQRCERAEESLDAIRRGAVDALLVHTQRGDQVFTLRGAEHPYRLFVETMSEGAITIAEDGSILYSNRRFAEILGISIEHVIGATIWEFVSPDGRQTVDSLLRAQKDRRENVEVGLRRMNGEQIICSVSVSTMALDEKLVFCMVVRDITLAKRNEEILEQRRHELARSNEELEQFAYLASHDLQTPLRHITSYVQLLAKKWGASNDSDTTKWVNYVVEGTRQMQSLISDILTYSKVGRIDSTFTEVSLERIVSDILEGLKEKVTELGAQIKIGNLPIIKGVPRQLEQLFQNLIDNALKFRRPEVAPRIEITSEERGEFWHIIVADNGIGINPQFAPRIFAMFQRLHTHTEYPGTGIGLAICKKIVELHGGQIWVESPPGKGSAFHFTLSKTIPHGESTRVTGAKD